MLFVYISIQHFSDDWSEFKMYDTPSIIYDVLPAECYVWKEKLWENAENEKKCYLIEVTKFESPSLSRNPSVHL